MRFLVRMSSDFHLVSVGQYEALSGRHYDVVEQYRMEDAEVALLLLNSAAETAKDAVSTDPDSVTKP